VYEPNIDGHRLFIRDGLCVYENNPPAIIFYRKDKESINFASHKNNIHIFTGPHLTT
jgi:ribosomal protein S18 acetylase RimI-like enzyme